MNSGISMYVCNIIFAQDMFWSAFLLELDVLKRTIITKRPNIVVIGVTLVS